MEHTISSRRRACRDRGPRRHGRLLGVALIAWAAALAGCGNVAQRISDIEARHGVVLSVTDAARGEDWLGGNTYAVVDNVGKELAAFPYLATAGRRIHIAASADLVRGAYPEEFLDALLAGAATQDHPGPDQGDIYVLNKNLWGLYVDAFQPGTSMLYDPHLRHEMMHAIEIDALNEITLAEPWQATLDQSGEMVHRMGVIDALALGMPGILGRGGGAGTAGAAGTHHAAVRGVPGFLRPVAGGPLRRRDG